MLSADPLDLVHVHVSETPVHIIVVAATVTPDLASAPTPGPVHAVAKVELVQLKPIAPVAASQVYVPLAFFVPVARVAVIVSVPGLPPLGPHIVPDPLSVIVVRLASKAIVTGMFQLAQSGWVGPVDGRLKEYTPFATVPEIENIDDGLVASPGN